MLTRKQKKFHPIRLITANRWDANQDDMQRFIHQKNRCFEQIKIYGRKFPQRIAKKELIYTWDLMFPKD